jgi:hypothetical protein
VADAGFFVDAVRPITQMRLRWDSAFEFKDPDRGEFFWAKENLGKVVQQVPNAGGRPNVPGKGPGFVAKKVDFEELKLYTEGATGTVGAFVEVPYREVSATPGAAADPAVSVSSQSNFADITAGTKTLLLDCELVQIGLQFKTYIPVGSTAKGFSTGHVSLEPALLFNLKIGPATYLQAETAYWIPIGGDQIYQSNVWHSHLSLNHICWQPCHDLQIIGTAELNEWTFYGGAYTIPDFGSTVGGTVFGHSATTSMLSVGPGIRGVVCDKFDLGVGSAFAVTGTRMAREMIRADLRIRF